MKVGVVLAGLLHATCAIEGTVSKREAYLWRLESCPEEELRRRLELKFANNDIMDVWEVVKREGICTRSERLDGYLAMLGMMLTDGGLRSRYVSVFGTNGLDVSRDEGMIRVLMGEMVDGEIWKEVSRRLAVMACRRLEEEGCNGGEARAESGGVPDVVNQIAWRVEKLLLSEDRSWGGVLEVLLRKRGMMDEVIEGRYNEELIRIVDEDEELGHVLYDYVLGRRDILNGMAISNEALGKKVVANAIDRGYWLYADVLEGFMEAESGMRKLFPEDDAFEGIRANCGVAEEGLSVGRLRELAREGRLDKLIKRMIERLIRHGEIDDLRRLADTVGRSVFDGLMGGERLELVLKKRIEALISKYGGVNDLERLLDTVGRSVFDELAGRGELDLVLRKRIEMLIRGGEMNSLERLIGIVGRSVFDGLAGRGELDLVLKKKIETIIRDGYMNVLKRLIEILSERFDMLLGGGELDLVLKEGIKMLIRYGWRDELKMLIETVKGRFDLLLGCGELDLVLKEGIEVIIRHRQMDHLKWLIETAKGRFDLLLGGGELDFMLRTKIETLIRYGEMNNLERLVGIVGRGVLDGMLGSGELGLALKEGIEKIVGERRVDGLEWLIGTVRGSVSEGLLGTALGEKARSLIGDGKIDDLKRLAEAMKGRDGLLDLALKEGTEGLFRDGKTDELKVLMETLRERFDVLSSAGELDLVLRKGIVNLIRGGWIDDLQMLVGIEIVERRVSGGLVRAGELDGVFREMVENMTRDNVWGKHDLMEAVNKGTFDGLVSKKELRVFSGKTMCRIV